MGRRVDGDGVEPLRRVEVGQREGLGDDALAVGGERRLVEHRPAGEGTDHWSAPVEALRTVIDQTPETCSTAATRRPVGEKAGRLAAPSHAGKAGPYVSCSHTLMPAKKTSG